MVGADPVEVARQEKPPEQEEQVLIPPFSISICVTQGKLQTVCSLVSLVSQERKFSLHRSKHQRR